MTRYLGIDPGLGGALACLEPDGTAAVWDTPVLTVQAPGSRRREYDVAALVDLVRSCIAPPGPLLAVVEAATPHPRDGKIGWLRTGYGCGLWHALLAACAVPYRIVPAATWKRAEDLAGRDKAASRLEASRRFPTVDLGRVKDHGRAEALLLADYARRQAW